jgi:hypothetical protein
MTAARRPLWLRDGGPKVEQLLRRAAHRKRVVAMETGVARDPRTGALRRGRVERVAFGVTLHLPKRLPTPNRWLKLHWSTYARIKSAWAEVIRLAVLDSSSAGHRLALRTTLAGAMGWIAPPVRARVRITRIVRHRRHFITDPDNRRFAGKALVDCLVDAGFLRDDSEDHIDLHVDQEVSTDGLDWTVVAITVPEDER